MGKKEEEKGKKEGKREEINGFTIIYKFSLHIAHYFTVQR